MSRRELLGAIGNIAKAATLYIGALLIIFLTIKAIIELFVLVFL